MVSSPRQTPKAYLICPVRQQRVQKLPEEVVRIAWIDYLLSRGYPLESMCVEKRFGAQKRLDVLVYDPQGAPFLLVECKKTHPGDGMRQLLGYNLMIQSPYVALVSGTQVDLLDVRKNMMLSDLPKYPDRQVG